MTGLPLALALLGAFALGFALAFALLVISDRIARRQLGLS